MLAQKFERAGRFFISQILIAGAVRMLVYLYAFINLVSVLLRVQPGDEIKTAGAHDGMSRPVQIQVGMTGDGTQGRMRGICQPQRLGRMGVPGSQPQGGKFGLGVQLRHDLVAAGDRQFIRTNRRKGILTVNIKRSNEFFFG